MHLLIAFAFLTLLFNLGGKRKTKWWNRRLKLWPKISRWLVVEKVNQSWYLITTTDLNLKKNHDFCLTQIEGYIKKIMFKNPIIISLPNLNKSSFQYVLPFLPPLKSDMVKRFRKYGWILVNKFEVVLWFYCSHTESPAFN